MMKRYEEVSVIHFNDVRYSISKTELIDLLWNREISSNVFEIVTKLC